MPLPQIRLAWQPPPNLSIDQPGYGTRPGGVILAMMTIGLIQGLIAPHSSNAVFDHNPASRERLVIRDVLGWSVFAARFAARGGAQAFRVQLVDAHVRQITYPAHARRQPLEQLRLLQK